MERYGRSVSCKLVVLPSLRMGEMKAKERREHRGADSHLEGSLDMLCYRKFIKLDQPKKILATEKTDCCYHEH